MVNFMMSVNRYCADCMQEGQFQPLQFVMMNITSGMWMCPKSQCIFPMNSVMMKDYIEDNLTTEKVLQLTRKGRRNTKEKGNTSEITQERVNTFLSTDTSSTMAISTLTSTRHQAISKPSSLASHLSDGSLNSQATSKFSASTLSYNDVDDVGDYDDNDSISTTTTATTASSTSLSLSLRHNATYYPLWENTNLLCWLDAALAMLVLNTSMDKLIGEEQCLIGHLYTEYKKIIISYNTLFDYKTVHKQLDRLRTNILKFLQPKLMANYTDEDSPLVCLPLVLRTSKILSEALEVTYECKFYCNSCGFERNDGFNKIVMTLPNCGDDLDFTDNIYHYRSCYKCFSGNQKTKYSIDKFPSVLFVHFPEGVQKKKFWTELNFLGPEGDHYVVTQIIQYLNRKRHFILWSYSYQEQLWCECDDLKDPVVCHKHKRPRCRPKEVHLLIWERLSHLQTLPPIEKSNTNSELDSPCSFTAFNAVSPSPSALSVLVSATESTQSAEDSRQCSRASSLSSGDNVSAYGGRPAARGSQVLAEGVSLQPLRSVRKDVKGLRNTPRYEPYVSRKFRTPTTAAGGSHGNEKSDGSERADNTGTSTPTEERLCRGNIVYSDSKPGRSRDTGEMTSSGFNSMPFLTSSVQGTLQSSEDSFDFLRDVLSEELNSIGEDLFDGNGGLGPSSRDSPEDDNPYEVADDFIAAEQDEDMKKIMQLFED